MYCPTPDKNKNYIILVAVFLLAIIGTGIFIWQDLFPKKETVNTQDFVLSSHKSFNLLRPNDWTEIQYGNAYIYLPPGADATDVKTEKITVAVSTLNKDENDLTKIMDEDVKQTRQLMPDLQESQTKTATKIGPLDSLRVRYAATAQKQPIEIHQIDAIFPTSSDQFNIIFKIGHVCPMDKCAFNAIFDKMLSSFEPIDPTASLNNEH